MLPGDRGRACVRAQLGCSLAIGEDRQGWRDPIEDPLESRGELPAFELGLGQELGDTRPDEGVPVGVGRCVTRVEKANVAVELGKGSQSGVRHAPS